MAPIIVWALSLAAVVAGQIRLLEWIIVPTNTEERFRGISLSTDEAVWVSGTSGTVLRTATNGQAWASVGPRLVGDESILEFRDIEAISEDKAVVLSIGNGNRSRIYLTEDAGKTWTLPFVSMESDAFYDCLAFESATHGIAMSDPVQGAFRLVETKDGGKSWFVLAPGRMPAAQEGEAGFAASGSCLSTHSGRWYLGSGGNDPGRVFYSTDGQDWDVSPSTIVGGEGSGVFAVDFRNQTHGIAVGGNYSDPTRAERTASWTNDGGMTWNAAESYPGGYRSDVAWIGTQTIVDAIAVGPSGSDITSNGGRTWYKFENGSFDSIDCRAQDERKELPWTAVWSCWASGEKGRVAHSFFNYR